MARRHLTSYDASLLRPSSAQRRRRPSRDPGAARPCVSLDDAEVHPPQRLPVDRRVQESASEGIGRHGRQHWLPKALPAEVQERSTPQAPWHLTRVGIDSESMTNRLANETSPYLLQHAHNPVDWYP